MGNIKKILRNSIFLGTSHVLTKLISLLSISIITRYLGADTYGVFTFVVVYVSFFAIIVDLGIDQIVLREASKDINKAGIIIGNTFLLKTCLALVAIIAMCFVTHLSAFSAEKTYLIMLYSLSLLLMPFSQFRIGFSAVLDQRIPAIMRVIEQVLNISLIMAVIFLVKGKLVYFVIVQLITSAFISGAYVYYGIRIVRPVFNLKVSIWASILRDSLPLALNSVLIMVYLRVDQLMIGPMLGDRQLGLYSVLVQYSEMFAIIPGILFSSVFPLMSRYYMSERDKFYRISALSFKYINLFSFSVAAISSRFPKEIIGFIYGNEYVSGASALPVLMGAQFFAFAGIVHFNMLIAQNNQRINLLFAMVSMMVNVVLNILWIPLLGIKGAAWASLVAYGVGFPMAYAMKSTRQNMKLFIAATMKPLSVFVILAIWLFVFAIPAIYVVVLFPMIFCFAVVYTGIIGNEDKEVFRALISRTVA